MNLQEYISSGILESYVLGDLSDRERNEVESNLSLYPELREELARIEEAQEQFLLGAAIDPPASSKQNLMEQAVGKAAPTRDLPSVAGAAPLWWKYIAAAVLILALVNGYLAYDYHSKWQDAREEVEEMVAQNEQLATERNSIQEVLNETSNDLEIISDPSFQKILLTGTDNSPQSLAQVFWNSETREVYLNIENLGRLSTDQQYQLWAIVDGTPVDAGVFDLHDGLLKMKKIGGAAAFAVTVEQKGGNAKPTLETLQVIGNT